MRRLAVLLLPRQRRSFARASMALGGLAAASGSPLPSTGPNCFTYKPSDACAASLRSKRPPLEAMNSKVEYRYSASSWTSPSRGSVNYYEHHSIGFQLLRAQHATGLEGAESARGVSEWLNPVGEGRERLVTDMLVCRMLRGWPRIRDLSDKFDVPKSTLHDVLEAYRDLALRFPLFGTSSLMRGKPRRNCPIGAFFFAKEDGWACVQHGITQYPPSHLQRRERPMSCFVHSNLEPYCVSGIFDSQFVQVLFLQSAEIPNICFANRYPHPMSTAQPRRGTKERVGSRPTELSYRLHI